MTDYKPGTVAKATVRGVPDVTVMRYGNDVDDACGWLSERAIHGLLSHTRGQVTDVRPLVVLDLDYLSSIPEARRNMLDGMRHGHVIPFAIEQVLDQIEAQTRPAIEEPKGLGAVVEDADGERWVRGPRDGWTNLDAKGVYLNWKAWDDRDDPLARRAVRVLSPGVEP